MTNSQSQPTISQITGALTIRQIWAFVLAISTSGTAIVGFAFWFWQQTAASSANEKLARSQTETQIQTERVQQATDKLKQYAEYTSTLNSQIAQRDAQIISLNERLGKTNTCGYLQQQISSLEQQISNVNSGKRFRGLQITIFGGSEEEQQKRDAQRKQRDDDELAQLQQRIITYSQQLSGCAK